MKLIDKLTNPKPTCLRLKRMSISNEWSVGFLYINDVFFCHTIEDTDRGLYDSMTEEQIKRKKVYGKTAIPRGAYRVTLDVYSPKFGKKPFYRQNANGGKVPRLINVKGFTSILIHCGVDQNSTEGCIIVGYIADTHIHPQATKSQETFTKLYKRLMSTNGSILLIVE